MSTAHAIRSSRKGALIGAAALGIPGAVLGSTKKNRATGEERTTKQRVVGGLVGGIAGASYGSVAGAGIGYDIGKARGFRPPPTPDWLKGAKTKAEGRKLYHAQARKLHPDLGGSEEAIKKLNNDWAKHERMFKTAMLNAFADELEKIALVGAALGAYAGSKFPGRNKPVNILAGAAIGHAAGALAKGVKRQVWDEQQAREHQALYGYQPSYGRDDQLGTYF